MSGERSLSGSRAETSCKEESTGNVQGDRHPHPEVRAVSGRCSRKRKLSLTENMHFCAGRGSAGPAPRWEAGPREALHRGIPPPGKGRFYGLLEREYRVVCKRGGVREALTSQQQRRKQQNNGTGLGTCVGRCFLTYDSVFSRPSFRRQGSVMPFPHTQRLPRGLDQEAPRRCALPTSGSWWPRGSPGPLTVAEIPG